ncbi:MAG: Exopolyphosphatase [Bogoriella megaspora]|nr:MAG: Exopolyphosphatase [Bogoriella megaspora]
MSAPHVSVKAFLLNAKFALRTAIRESRQVHFIIGNESADLDSLTSSLLYAYIRGTQPRSSSSVSTYVPVVNIPRSDLTLRPEFQALLPHAGVEAGDLITLTDLPDTAHIKKELPPENTFWTLVDHNALQGEIGIIYGRRVVGVIDHHDDEKKVPLDTGEEPRVIEKSGSCTSLVTKYIRESWKSVSAAESSDDDDAQLAKIAIASILIDTANLASKDKTTEHDQDAVALLEDKIRCGGPSLPPYNRTAFFEEISKAKSDIESLALQDILRKDYKQWTEGSRNLGVSSVVKPISFLRQKAKTEASSSTKQNLLQAIDTFADARELGMYALMTTSTSSTGAFQRELLLKAFTPEDAQAATKFASNATKELRLDDWETDELDEIAKGETWSKVWWQRNVEHSRKRVGPLLREAMN